MFEIVRRSLAPGAGRGDSLLTASRGGSDVRRFGVALAAIALATIVVAGAANTAPPAGSVEPVKINVMGEWAHPDDDTSIIGPCGVWHQRYGVRCGIIQVTRGEGGGNAVGTELGPDLGLRRENEDRVAHYRSGTVDFFFLDKVDFFYNQSAPLTEFFWGHDDTLGRITRIIRMTKPDVYIGFTPTQGAGHGHHQWAGRMIWEGMTAAADPTMFPDQLAGPESLETWQVKKAFSGGSTAGTGGTTASADCTTGFVPAATNVDTVVGAWTGYASPYLWPAGNVHTGAGDHTPGNPKIWEQVHNEGTAAYPTQSRVMNMGAATPNCRRFGMTRAYVPFQPNTNPDGTANPLAGKDDAILYGATVADPGGLPLGTLEYLTFSRFFNVAGVPFQATLHVKSGAGTLPAGTAALTVPAGWTVEAAKPIGPIGDGAESTVTFTVTPAANAAVNSNFRISALVSTGGKTGYTDNAVRIVPPVEGRFQRWGNWAEYDQWLATRAPQAYRLGRSAAVQTMPVTSSRTIPVVVHNWSDAPQSGTVTLGGTSGPLPAGLTATPPSQPYGPLAPGAEATVNFEVSNTFTNSTLPVSAAAPNAQNTNLTVRITTTFGAAGTSFEDLTLGIVPKTTIPAAAAAPTLDGAEGAGEYTGEALDIGRKWEPGGSNRNCDPPGVDCGNAAGATPGAPNTTYAKVTRSGDDLYFFIHIVDDFQSYAVTPQECVGHWLADSVEILIDPRANGSQQLLDTAAAFKLGIFPFTNDPTNFNGNGVNGPCWERDADNHQGFATGPLAATVDDAPNAPGVQVVSTATWVGTNSTTVSHSYGAAGGYNLEVKIPMADLPAAVDPNDMGLNITPYDEDNTAAAGTTTLRHIDQSTRMAWSTFGSVQSDPYRWGRATLTGYAPPAGRPTTTATPNVSHPNLNGTLSPQTIYTSALNGVPISGRKPVPAGDRLELKKMKLSKLPAAPKKTPKLELEVQLKANGNGTAQIFLWSGDPYAIPVFLTSCAYPTDPVQVRDYGLSACSTTDGGIPPWSPDMSGRVVDHVTVDFDKKKGKEVEKVKISLTQAQYDKLAGNGSVLISFETPNDEVQALYAPVEAG
jgi:LmbE family N-acetylglucosaminyl deacetylase